jgi:hypothetical protein
VGEEIAKKDVYLIKRGDVDIAPLRIYRKKGFV